MYSLLMVWNGVYELWKKVFHILNILNIHKNTFETSEHFWNDMYIFVNIINIFLNYIFIFCIAYICERVMNIF